jgi:hypothetical protein
MAMGIASLHPSYDRAFTSRFRHQPAVSWALVATRSAVVAVQKPAIRVMQGAGYTNA